tara:strand:- start:918 stop:1103 length:186 start_codon:yes stop_codon:yes gene_type:complete
MSELKEGQEVTINIPFTYTIGEEGYHTNKVLRTVQDCKDEVLAEMESDSFIGNQVYLDEKK